MLLVYGIQKVVQDKIYKTSSAVFKKNSIIVT